MEEKILFWEFLFVISFAPAWNYLFKVNNLSTKLFNMKNVNVNDIQYERCQWRRSNVFIVNCNYISNFLLQTLTLTKKMQLTFKMTCCMYMCLFTDFAC